MENNNQQSASKPAEKSQQSSISIPQAPQSQLKKIVIVITILIAFIVIGIGGYILSTSKKQPKEQYNQTGSITPTESRQNLQASLNDLFLFSIPKPIDTLTIEDLPNTEFLGSVVEYNDSLWFTGRGSLIEYDTKSEKLISYTNPRKVACGDEAVALIKDRLFVGCKIKTSFNKSHDSSSNAILKINPMTHKVEYVITKQDGLVDVENSYFYPDGSIIWIATNNGIIKFDTEKNKGIFYSDELGIHGTELSIGHMLINQDYVWVAIGANSFSPGGLSLYNKKTQTWKAFNVRDLKDYFLDRFDLETIKPIRGGVQVGFLDGEIGRYDRFVEKQYNYESGKWTKINEQPYTVEYREKIEREIASIYLSSPSSSFNMEVDRYGLTQFRSSKTGQVYLINGRDNFVISPLIGEKRYILTRATIDVIDKNSKFPQILVKLGSQLEKGLSYSDLNNYKNLVQFLIEPKSLLAVVTDSGCGGRDCSENPKVWFIDLKAGRLNGTYTKLDGINGEQLSDLSMNKVGDLLVIKDKNEIPLFNINTTNYILTSLAKK